VITYAQNFEDVILARVFSERIDGFYVDIGACHPDVASVTRHFYEAGWSGVNVEPVRESYERLVAARSRDVNLCIAIAGHTGKLKLYEGASVGETSATPPYPGARGIESPCITLAALCEQYADRAIDFLKIDVEGMELDVVASGDWNRFRPAVVVIEITLPWTPLRRPASAKIASILAASGYREAYFDGINAFFIACEAEHLAPRLAFPPCVLDRFKPATEALLEDAVASLKAQSENHLASIAAADARAAGAEAERAAAVRAYHEVVRHLDSAVAQSKQDAEAVRAASLRGDVLERELERTRAHSEAAGRAIEAANAARGAAEAQLARFEVRATQAEQWKRDAEARTAQAEAAAADMMHAHREALARLASAAEQSRRDAEAVRAASVRGDVLERELARSTQRVGELQRDFQAAEARASRAAHWEAKARHSDAAFHRVVESRSWRITAPLRRLRAVVHRSVESDLPAAASGACRPFSESWQARCVSATASFAKRMGFYDPLAGWLRSRHPVAWAKLKQSRIGAPSSALPAPPAEAVAIAPSSDVGFEPQQAAAQARSDVALADSSELTLEAIKERILVEMRLPRRT